MSHQLLRRAVGGESLPVSDVLDALSVERRRIALRRLSTSAVSMTVHELACEMAAGVDSACDSDRIATALHHSDLPQLDELGFVSYDEAAAVVEPTDAIEELLPYLEYLDAKREQ